MSLEGKKIEIMNTLRGLQLWEEVMMSEFPRKWEKYGDLVLFSQPCFTHPNWALAGPDLWELICKHWKVKRIAIKTKIKNNGYRSPQVNLVHGVSSMVMCVDNGIKYSWDVTQNMFSAGNATERHRVGSLDCRGEVVVDLFSGIGHFTLPYLVKAGAKFVHACDWNPDAIMALRRNLELNKVQDRCKIYEGDCRKVCPDGVANRVNLGLIPSSECGWEPACRALVPSTGGILYIHQNVETPRKTIWQSTCSVCELISGFLHLFGAGNNEHDKYKYAITSLLRGYPPVEVTNCTGVNSASCVSDAETIVWKHLEWFQFGLHITHSIAGIMEKIRGGMWAARITQVHRVKSYAPRVDHLVYTLQCYQK